MDQELTTKLDRIIALLELICYQNKPKSVGRPPKQAVQMETNMFEELELEPGTITQNLGKEERNYLELVTIFEKFLRQEDFSKIEDADERFHIALTILAKFGASKISDMQNFDKNKLAIVYNELERLHVV